jgi:hypothetical protein
MTTPDEDQIQSIWKSQPILTVSMTPELLQARAARFEKATRRRNRGDFVSFAVVALIFGIGAAALQNPLTRTGALLLALWAVIGVYSVRKFHALTALRSPESSASTCMAWYQEQLERQRDVALSRPWGLALGLPGLVLLLIGYVDSGVPWTFSAILAGVGLFLGVGVIIHGKILAGRWQAEIHSLQRLQRDQ